MWYLDADKRTEKKQKRGRNERNRNKGRNSMITVTV